MKEKQIILVIILAGIALALAYWLTRGSNGSSRRGALQFNKPKGARRSDQRELSPQERRVKRQAKKLLAKGKTHQAAQLLEQVGLYRDAISTLENANFIDDAVKVLLRMQKPERAGVVYSRHGYWVQAAQCFLLAENKIDAAKCYREAGQYSDAGDLFAKEKAHQDAAECYQHAKNYESAAQFWIRANNKERALQCWSELAKDPQLLIGVRPTEEDFQYIFRSIHKSDSNSHLNSILAKSPSVHFFILELIKSSNLPLAQELFLKCGLTIADVLVSNVNIQAQNTALLAKLFENTKTFRHAAIIHEQLGDFSAAANAFMLAGDEERARYCSDRIQGKPKATSIGAQLTPEPFGTPSSLGKSEPIRASIPVIGGFVIESTLPDKVSSLKPEILPPQLKENDEVQPTIEAQSDDLSNDELKFLRRSWLFENVLEDDLDLIVSLFSCQINAANQLLSFGANHLYLGLIANGSIALNHKTLEVGDWVGLEECFGAMGEISAVTQTPTRMILISQRNFDRMLNLNLDLTRALYTNLTRHLASNRANSPILKAI